MNRSDVAVERDERANKTCREGCFMARKSEPHGGREVEEQAVEYCRESQPC